VLAAVGGALPLASVWISTGILAVAAPYPGVDSRPATEPAGLTLRRRGDDVAGGAVRVGAGPGRLPETSVNETLKQASRSATGDGRRRLRHALVVVEVRARRHLARWCRPDDSEL